jgi:hypothetical protein
VFLKCIGEVGDLRWSVQVPRKKDKTAGSVLGQEIGQVFGDRGAGKAEHEKLAREKENLIQAIKEL